MIRSDFWLDDTGARRDVVDLRNASCPRCPQPISEVPVDKAWVVAYPGDAGHVRFFVCPHCRIECRSQVEREEALRLFAAGVTLRRPSTRTRGGLDEDALIEFGRALADEHELARLAFEGP